MYTAASMETWVLFQNFLTGTLFLSLGEGEYGVTDMLYAAARSKSSEVLLVFGEGEYGGYIGDIPSVYKWEMMNETVHALIGGNLNVLKQLLADCSDILAYRDIQAQLSYMQQLGEGRLGRGSNYYKLMENWSFVFVLVNLFFFVHNTTWSYFTITQNQEV